LNNPELAELSKPIVDDNIVTCDTEPKSIRELKDHKINARSAVKGKDSVNFGIQWLRQQSIIIDIKCINTRNEFAGYKWKEDKGGVAIPIPVDRNNHLIDALRYAYEQDMTGGIHITPKATVTNWTR
jgi:phage terminase large subunit